MDLLNEGNTVNRVRPRLDRLHPGGDPGEVFRFLVFGFSPVLPPRLELGQAIVAELNPFQLLEFSDTVLRDKIVTTLIVAVFGGRNDSHFNLSSTIFESFAQSIERVTDFFFLFPPSIGVKDDQYVSINETRGIKFRVKISVAVAPRPYSGNAYRRYSELT